jgi:hypothetical protein
MSYEQSLIVLFLLFHQLLVFPCLTGLFKLLQFCLLLRFLQKHLLHPLQFLKAEIDFIKHLVAFILLCPELSGEGVVLLLDFPHALLVLAGDLHDLVDGHCLFGRTVLVVDVDHACDFSLQLLGLLLVADGQLGRLLTDLSELLELLSGHLLLLVALHSNYYKHPPTITTKPRL